MGGNQRARIRMTDEEVATFLHDQRTAVLCTMHPRGSIHAVAMWYGFVDGHVALETKTKSQKAQNLRRDPRMTLLVEDGDSYDELRGVELVGTGELFDDPDKLWQLGVSMYQRYLGEYTEQARPMVEAMLHNRVGILMRTERTVSWDHRKLS
ncbi:pyridoxamine 5'-phosphate oxidase family protein [Gandjariella thermophila]|uniref:PPOX class F420-dependent enzyme n=1 Tax=Gandjariella thermophila TaxID=1931992 RepID=A0A4D4IX89_9PSEU|nr:TIGR03618 family F420-dependent PPOX class oxidoreductase [Gandjariella thermophila]GDY28975.1 PPOX class F420-dependent enzyme [Gandjariella thermophila]